MKKFFIILMLIFFGQTYVLAEIDWEQLYEESSPPSVKLMNNIDPYDDEDNVNYAYSPFPLFRTSIYLYYKGTKIEPGYYVLTPRKMAGEYYIFFKTNGRVKHIIPVVKREYTPALFYKNNIPAPKLTKWQKFKKANRNFWGKIFKGSGKQPPPPSYIEIEAKNYFYILKFYFGEHCYYSVFKTTPY